jgi:DNA-binding transcriptional LysR family regulator
MKKHKINDASDLCMLDHIHYSRNNLAKIYSMTSDSVRIASTFNDISLIREAVLNSRGWGMLPTYTVKKEIVSGSLMEIKETKKWSLTSYKFGIWWNRDKAYLKPYVNTLREWLSGQNLNLP